MVEYNAGIISWLEFLDTGILLRVLSNNRAVGSRIFKILSEKVKLGAELQ